MEIGVWTVQILGAVEGKREKPEGRVRGKVDNKELLGG